MIFITIIWLLCSLGLVGLYCHKSVRWVGFAKWLLEQGLWTILKIELGVPMVIGPLIIILGWHGILSDIQMVTLGAMYLLGSILLLYALLMFALIWSE